MAASNPTLSPTTCLDNTIPDFLRQCLPPLCGGPSALVALASTTLTKNVAAGTTRICYAFTLTNGGPACNPSGNPILGASFVMDECCPVPRMEFLDTVSITDGPNSFSFNRVQCPVGDVTQAFATSCARTSRPCVTVPGKQGCKVLNLNNLNIGVTGLATYCLTISGTDYDDGAGNVLPPQAGPAKICFERGSTSPPGLNLCTCVTVPFIKSQNLCDGLCVFCF